MSGETRRLAEFISDLNNRSLDDSIREVIGHAMLDTVGCALYGRELEWSQAALNWARSSGASFAPGVGASVWGGERISLRPSEAAFVNGIAAHAYELDDYHPVKIHPGAVVVPAALALAEVLDSTGERLLSAVVAGYEVMTRIAYALEPSTARMQGWHLTGVTGTYGSAAAAAVLLGLDVERTAWALGLAGTQSSGLFAFTADGAMSKRFHAGDAARAGIVAAELAAAGFSGPTQVLEAADGGMLKAFSSAAEPARVVANLGDDWLLLNTAFKPYSCCGSLHSYIDATLELRERFGAPEQARLRVGLPKVVQVQCGFDYEPGSVLSAQMNARYCVASALRYGQVLPPEFAEERLVDSDTLAVMERIEQVHAEELDSVYPKNFCGWVEMETEPGRFERVYRHDPSGGSANPDKSAAMIEKLRSLLATTSKEYLGGLEAALLDPRNRSVREIVGVINAPA